MQGTFTYIHAVCTWFFNYGIYLSGQFSERAGDKKIEKKQSLAVVRLQTGNIHGRLKASSIFHDSVSLGDPAAKDTSD